MYKIQTNPSGTRSIVISEEHLQTIEDYQFFRDLIDSNGYVDEQVLDKLKLNIRALLESEAGKDKRLLDLCLDVIYNSNMKSTALHHLVMLFVDWQEKRNQDSHTTDGTEAV
jgi:hypothetical protein